MQIAGNVPASDYSVLLNGGKQYYLYIGYYKDKDVMGEELEVTDTFTINNVEVYGTTGKSYGFDQEGVKYISNNQVKSNTIASGYVPIDLIGLDGEYEIKVNAEISSEENDYAYATIKTDESMPDYYNDGITVINNISGEIEQTDYTAVVEGGQRYYLHFVYTKNNSVNERKDAFTINTIRVKKNESDLFEKTVVTNENGRATVKLKVGKYDLIEIDAPYGYKVPEEKIQEIEVLRKNDDVTQIDVYNEKAEAEVIVHHYIYDEEQGGYTNQKVPLNTGEDADDVIKSGFVGEAYETEPLDDKTLKPGYKLHEEPENNKGTMTVKPIEVSYYYESTGIDMESNITKEGTEEITSKDELVNYTIKYEANVKDYTGTVTVTITDTLPYALDLDAMEKIYNEEHKTNSEQLEQVQEDLENREWLKTMLNGGKYEDTEDAEGNHIYTITWEEQQQISNTAEVDEPQKVAIEKNIKVIYKDINLKANSFVNTVKGEIKIDEMEQVLETQPVQHETKTKFVKNIKINKIWDHGNNTKEQPKEIEVQVKNKEQVIDTYKLNAENNWTHIFTDLPKYDDEGNEIEYSVDEVQTEDLKYYEKQIN